MFIRPENEPPVFYFFLVPPTGCSNDFSCCSLGLDCRYYYDIGQKTSGVYHVTPPGAHAGYDVYCDMVTDGGGWLVFQRRVDGSVDFYRDWNDYEVGFGNVSHEHWLGLLPLKRLLSQGWYMYELRIDLENFEGDFRYAKYSFFNLGDILDSYTLYITGYSGTAGDSLRSHNGRMFSTRDRENDVADWANCAEHFKGLGGTLLVILPI